MGFFEETAAFAKGLYETGEKKATEVINIQKINSKINNLESRMNGVYCKIGKQVAACREEERFADFADSFAEIDSIVAEVEKLRCDLAEAKGCESCPKCGCFSAKGSKFCSQCGEKF